MTAVCDSFSLVKKRTQKSLVTRAVSSWRLWNQSYTKPVLQGLKLLFSPHRPPPLQLADEKRWLRPHCLTPAGCDLRAGFRWHSPVLPSLNRHWRLGQAFSSAVGLTPPCQLRIARWEGREPPGSVWGGPLLLSQRPSKKGLHRKSIAIT